MKLKPTRRRLEILECAARGHLRAHDYGTLFWHGRGLLRTPSEVEMDDLIDEGLIEHLLDEENYSTDQKTGEVLHDRIARLTPTGQAAMWAWKLSLNKGGRA